jgi:hypothetical protein
MLEKDSSNTAKTEIARIKTTRIKTANFRSDKTKTVNIENSQKFETRTAECSVVIFDRFRLDFLI